jgi:tetratricopeptide (TPR) repeat protein
MLRIGRHSARLGLMVLTGSLFYGDPLPDLPVVNTANFLPAIRRQIDRALADAKARPRDANATGILAMTLHAYQQHDGAARAYSRAHLLDPQNFDWIYLLGAAQMQLGAFDAAAKSLRAALTIRSGDVSGELRLAEALLSSPRLEEAGTIYRNILAAHPDHPQAWYGLGRVQSARGDHAGAAEAYLKACNLFPRYGAAHFALVTEFRRQGRSEEAKERLAAYSQYPAAEPPLDDPLLERIRGLNQSATVHIQRGMDLEKAGKLPEAIREHEAALASDPSNVQIHINLISLYGRTSEFAKAKEHFDASLQQNPGRADAWYNYGVLLTHEKNDAEAEQAFRRAIAINPYYAEARNNLGAIYQQRGRLDDAAREFRRAIADQPSYPLARFQLGRILVNQNNYTEAIEQFQKALEPAGEKTPTYLYALGATYARAGNRQEALRYLRQARNAASAHGQTQLVASIERDLLALQK